MTSKMKNVIAKLSAVMVLVSGVSTLAQTPTKVSYSVASDKVVNPIDVGIHGQFLEHIFNSVHGGLWGDMVRNPSLEATGGGGWVIEDNTVKSTGRITDQRLVFGDEKWGDYEVQLEARKLDGAEGFIVLFRTAGEGKFYWANMGGWQNREHGFEKARRPFGKRMAGMIEKERWYRVRVRCEGPHYQVWLDDQLVLDAIDTQAPVLHGAIGLSGWDSHVQFRGIKVTSLDGKTLFEGLPPRTALAVAPAYWKMFGSADFSADNREPFNGQTSLRIKRQGEEGEAGLRQKPMLIRGGERYHGALWMKGTAASGVQVRLMSEDGQLVFRQELSPVGAEWKKQTFAFTAAHTVSNAVFELALANAGDVSVDMLSLFSKSALETGGFRPDLLQAIAEQKPATIRYPGGCFASAYRWKDGIGPREKRVYFPNVIWADQDPNQMGTDEFMLLCEKVGAEPVIPINMALGEQEALEWMEYCNGDASTVWGKVRAANGHPKPYNVKYWEIDNETWGMGPEKYAEVVTKFSKALRAKNPSIKIIACGSYGYDDGKGSSNGWNKRLLASAAKDFDYLSIHYYNGICYAQDYVEDPRRFEAFMKDEVAGLIKASVNPAILIYCSEWGMMNASWKSGLYTGGILNAFERAGELVPMACPAVWLQTAPAAGEPRWASCSILFDHRTWYPAPTYVVQKMWRDNFAPNRLAMEGPEKPINAVATKSADGKTFYFKAVNVGKEAVDVVLTLAGKAKVDSAEYQLAAPIDENVRNSLDTPHKIWPKAAEVKVDGQTVLFAMPPLSAGVLKMNMK